MQKDYQNIDVLDSPVALFLNVFVWNNNYSNNIRNIWIYVSDSNKGNLFQGEGKCWFYWLRLEMSPLYCVMQVGFILLVSTLP